MNKRDEKFSKQMKLKFGCELDSCVSSITFTVTEFEHLKDKSRVRAYTGQCSRCHSVVKLTKSSFSNFERIFGFPKLAVTKANFDALFDAEQ